MSRKKRGFTIIEVVLVLAIAGLIFIMVFIALPTLQRSQRDTQRKNNLSAIVAAMNSWYTHNARSVTDIYGNSRQVNHGPVGTATALLVTLGAGTVAYKVRKNKKEKEEAKN